jgi:hypothetical protein
MDTANEEDRGLVEGLRIGSQSLRLPQTALHPIERNLWQFVKHLSRITA